MIMNKELFPATGDNDFDRPPEQELVTLFASCAPSARPVDVDALLPAVVTTRSRFTYWRKPMLRRVAVLALSTICVVGIIAALVLFGSGSQFSFAAVQEKMGKTQSVMFKLTTKVDPGAPPEIDRMLVLADGLSRIERPNGNYTVMDMKNGKAVLVVRQDKKAQIFLGLNVPSGVNPYELLRSVVNGTSKRLADEVIDGRKVSVFRTEIMEQKAVPRQLWKVWADSETKLPIRMEPIPQNDKEPMAIYDFVFDQPLEPSLFSLDPPEGYAVTTEGLANLPAPPDKPDLRAPEVIPGVGLGPVKFYMSKEEALKILGKPDVEEDFEKGGSIGYPSRGYNIFIGVKSGVVAGFSCFSQEEMGPIKVRDFAGRTKEGIGIGSNVRDLEKAFGKPDSKENNGRQTTYVRYNRLGLSFTLFSDKIVGMTMLRPKAEKPKGDSTK
jgi:outer membrane lipoprotein-sorting protein